MSNQQNSKVNVPQVFDFDNHQVRTVVNDEGQVLFIANDITDALGYTNSREALSKHVDKEDVTKRDMLTKTGNKLTNTINESGMYSLILSSKKKEAKKFKRWVTADVLPKIRQTGSYTLSKPQRPRINASGRDQVRVIVKNIVDSYQDYYFQYKDENKNDYQYSKPSAYKHTYAFIKSYFNLDKGGYKNLAADELNRLKVVLLDNQKDFLADKVFVKKCATASTTLPSLADLTATHHNEGLFTDEIPNLMQRLAYQRTEREIDTSIFNLKVLLKSSQCPDWFDEQKLQSLNHAYNNVSILSNQISSQTTLLQEVLKAQEKHNDKEVG